MMVYVRRQRFGLIGWVTLVIVVAVVLGIPALIGGVRHLGGNGNGVGAVFAGIMLLLLAVLLIPITVRAHRLRRHQSDPYFLVDDQGIECARGGFSWQDIRRVVQVKDGATRSVIFVLRDGTTPRPVERAYLDGFGADPGLFPAARLTQYGLELSLNECYDEAHSALASCGQPPVEIERRALSSSGGVSQ